MNSADSRAGRAPLVRSLFAVALAVTVAIMMPTTLGNVILLLVSFLLALRTGIDGVRDRSHDPSLWSLAGTSISAAVILYIVFLRVLPGDVPMGYGP